MARSAILFTLYPPSLAHPPLVLDDAPLEDPHRELSAGEWREATREE